jgi:fatty acid desaturase
MTPLITESASPTVLPEETRREVSQILTRDEIKTLTAQSDLRGLLAVGLTWAVIGAAFAGLSWAQSRPLALAIPAFVVGMCTLAGRQLCLAILMHDASCGTLFKTRWLNHVLADWLCARPIWNDLRKYRAHHFVHHTKTGTDQDTDISLVTPFPCSRASLAREFLRYLSGITGLKFLLGRLPMDMGYLKRAVANDVVRLPADGITMTDRLRMLSRNAAPTVVANAVLFALLWAVGQPWLFAAWAVASFCPLSLFVRLSSTAEHACTERCTDMFRNTRTPACLAFACPRCTPCYAPAAQCQSRRGISRSCASCRRWTRQAADPAVERTTSSSQSCSPTGENACHIRACARLRLTRTATSARLARLRPPGPLARSWKIRRGMRRGPRKKAPRSSPRGL